MPGSFLDPCRLAGRQGTFSRQGLSAHHRRRSRQTNHCRPEIRHVFPLKFCFG
jgi:hypothetical protein